MLKVLKNMAVDVTDRTPIMINLSSVVDVMTKVQVRKIFQTIFAMGANQPAC